MAAPTILLVATGGTIAGRHGSEEMYGAYASAADLIARLDPAVAASVATVDFSRKLSFEITLDEWLALARRIRDWNTDPAIAAIVVVQGTALMEEVPFLVSLFVESRKPIVFTGAMISGDRPDTDAMRNLVDALAVCRDRESTVHGPLVVMGGLAIAARTVRKAHRHAPDAIRSTEAPAATIADGRVLWHDGGAAGGTRPFPDISLARSVPLLKMVLGITPAEIDALLATRPDGLVVEGFPGGGGLPVDVAEVIEPMTGRIPVVLSSRAPEGRLEGSSAGSRSGGRALLRGGFISSGTLMSEKARLLVMAAIANAPAGSEMAGHVRGVFAAYMQGAT